MPDRSRKLPSLLVAGAILALGLVVVLIIPWDRDEPAGLLPDSRLSDLGEKPDWPVLQRYHGVLTRAEFEQSLREVYVLGDDWHCTITDEAVTIHSDLQPGGQVIRFAAPDARKSPPRYWRPVSELQPAPEGRPLTGLRIAIDPGHLGGTWAKMEERWYQLGDTLPVTEGDMMERNWEMIDAALEGLDESAMARQPTDQCNSVAWILWHLTRVTDMFIHTRLRDLTQVWVSEGWHEKFRMPADEEDRGVGWSASDVAQWRAPAKEVQLAYYEAVKNHAREFLANITTEELEREIVINPVPEPRTVAVCMGQMVWDTVAHGGQIAYLRGFYRGRGWFR